MVGKIKVKWRIIKVMLLENDKLLLKKTFGGMIGGYPLSFPAIIKVGPSDKYC